MNVFELNAARKREDELAAELAMRDEAAAVVDSAFRYSPSRDLVRQHVLDTSRMGHPHSTHPLAKAWRWFTSVFL